jgi:predicted nucleic acid-binding protein
LIVIDASLFAAWLLNEPDRGPADAVWEAILPQEIFVPVHWPNEVANALRRAVRTKRIQTDEVRPIADRAREFRLNFAAPTSRDEIGELALEALEHGLSAYDMIYVRIARDHQYRLATIDKAMRTAAQRLNVRMLPE